MNIQRIQYQMNLIFIWYLVKGGRGMIVRPLGGRSDPLPQAPTLLHCPPGESSMFSSWPKLLLPCPSGKHSTIRYTFDIGWRGQGMTGEALETFGKHFPQASTSFSFAPCPNLLIVQLNQPNLLKLSHPCYLKTKKLSWTTTSTNILLQHCSGPSPPRMSIFSKRLLRTNLS